ncbi:MAG: type IV pilus twitching motility protein PilT [Oligoflexales bacterium]|nr:type IV pilus twitching motility protein PilT [Oligoflexales bacterium]
MDFTLPQLLKTLIDQGASDLHISLNSAPRIRINGEIIPLNLPPLTEEQTKTLCYSVLTEQQKKKYEQTKELDFAFSVHGLARFRGNIFVQKNSVAAVFRIIPFKIHTLEQLGMPKVMQSLCELPRGLILITGPTGSGKTTTLASMIDHINVNNKSHIVTIEDPIEIVHEHKRSIVNQREIGGDTVDFAAALRSSLRQDPDVVLVGEMRDLETISLAIRTAETGHLVFATLHTNSALTSINRIIDVFPAHQQDQIRIQLSQSLQAVVSQLLLPSTQNGRVLGLEILIPNAAVRNLIRENKIHQIYSSMQTGHSESGMQTMNQSLCNLLQRRLITTKTAFSISPQADELMELINHGNKNSNISSQFNNRPLRKGS